jgi:hypothetical protein
MSLIDLITGNTGNQVAEQAENKFGISKGQIIALLAVAAPLIISYLRNKSQDANEAEALNNALDKDHDGSILNNPTSAVEREAEGNSILDHIFGGKSDCRKSTFSKHRYFNGQNRSYFSNVSSCNYGIYWSTKASKWRKRRWTW